MAGGAEDGVDRVAVGSGEVVSFEVPVFLQMADDRLDAEYVWRVLRRMFLTSLSAATFDVPGFLFIFAP